MSRKSAYREHADAQRASQAGRVAGDMVADLVAAVANRPDLIVEDALCLRLGTLLTEAEQNPSDDRPRLRDLADAVVAAAVESTEARPTPRGNRVSHSR